MLTPETVEETLGEAEVRTLFRSSRLGVIAGCYVTTGVIRRNARIRVVRDGTVVYDTTMASLKRFKEDVREVQSGFECDVLEAYETREIERTGLDVPAAAAAESSE